MNDDSKQYKTILLRTLHAFDDFCRENGLSYVGAYGTVIGAVRHQQLIPWDDDIDVVMLRKDYDRFVSLKDRVSEQYEIVDLDTEGYYLPFAKFCDAHSTVLENPEYPLPIGVFIDVFPVDEASDSPESRRLFKDHHKAFNKIKYGLRRPEPLTAKKFFSFKELKRFFRTRHYSARIPEVKDNYKKLQREASLVKGDCYLYYRSMDSFQKALMRKEWIDETILTPFEDMMMPIPKDYDSYLTKLYGDYMQLPPEDKRVPHPHLFCDLEKRVDMEEAVAILDAVAAK